MKKTFTKEYILSMRGCYDRDEVNNLSFINNKRITLKTLFNGLPIKDFSWFLVNKCDLTLTEKRMFALHCAKQVLPIYEKHYPEDKRVRECIEATEKYLNNKIDIDELREKRRAANAAAAAAYAAYADADANAADAYADAADADAYKRSIWEFVESIK